MFAAICAAIAVQPNTGLLYGTCPNCGAADSLTVLYSPLGSATLLRCSTCQADDVLNALNAPATLACSNGYEAMIYDSERGTAYEYADGLIVRRSPPKRISQSGNTADIAGDYEMVTHDKSSYFKGPKKVTDKTSTVYRGVNKPINITLKEDGTVTGDQTGTWEAVEGANQMTLKLTGNEGEVTYSGAFDKLPRDKDRKAVMTFSALGTNNLCIWGSQK